MLLTSRRYDDSQHVFPRQNISEDDAGGHNDRNALKRAGDRVRKRREEIHRLCITHFSQPHRIGRDRAQILQERADKHVIPANQLVGRSTHLEEHDDRKQNAAAEQAVAEVDLRG